MQNTLKKIDSTINLSSLQRMLMLLLGIGLIGLAMVQEGYLGWMSLFPLLAVYPICIALTGFSPVQAVLDQFGMWIGRRNLKRENEKFTIRALSAS